MTSTKSLPSSQVAYQYNGTAPVDKTLNLNQTAPVPSPLPSNSTLVKTLTASLNPVDYKLVEVPVVGRLAVGGWPHTPGIDFVGRVWATTLPESEGIKAGDLVFGKHQGPVKYGSLGSFTLAKGRDSVCKVEGEVGGNVEIDELATVGVAGLTAYEAVIPFVTPEKGHTNLEGKGKGMAIFINGASGGVGTYMVQIAKKVLQFDEVVVSCSAANADLVKSLGADDVINYRDISVVEGCKAWTQKKGRQFDLIVDNVGADFNIYWQAHHYLVEKGQYVIVGLGINMQAIVGLTKMMLWPKLLGGGKRKLQLVTVGQSREGLANIARWMNEGKVKAIIDSTYELGQAKEAYEKLRTNRARGKVVVRVSEDGRGE